MDKCKNCKYWRSQEQLENVSQIGHCHRYPPNGIEVVGLVWLPAATHENNWCGEYVRKQGHSGIGQAEIVHPERSS